MSADEQNMAALGAMVFTRPVGLEDVETMLKLARSMTWSAPAKFDIYCNDGKTTRLRVTIGAVVHEKVWHAV